MDYREAIRRALRERYRVDEETGEIFGPKGRLAIAKRGSQRYPTVSLSLVGEKQVVAPAHKVVAYALYGEDAFSQVVRHLDDNSLNLHPSNIALGTHADNNRDKDPGVRSAAARAARAAQGPHAPNAKFSIEVVRSIRQECRANLNENGRLRRGIGKRLAEKYGVTTAAITAIWKGKNYGE